MQGSRIKGYCFGDFYLKCNEVLYKSQQVVSVPPKEMHLLSILVECAGQVVNKEELIRTIWRYDEVNGESLTRCVYAVRKILGENPKGKYIKTLYGKGYVFVYPVSVANNAKVTHIPEIVGLVNVLNEGEATFVSSLPLPKNIAHDDESAVILYHSCQLNRNDKIKIAINLVQDLDKDQLYSSRVKLLKNEIIKKLITIGMST
ncbi:winged helix-turn-helix domain-containing protein [Erwinia sp. ErVv1]|uniref:winged helix-turn-helix domain-containing protein n=1 Tax=Erwinia sp. ErVv1 TaxID=1603299 RepID=UPI00082B43A9|nr:winged helix-turn-helix domain-containing protein [Erwinia sp. ErVv1]